MDYRKSITKNVQLKRGQRRAISGEHASRVCCCFRKEAAHSLFISLKTKFHHITIWGWCGTLQCRSQEVKTLKVLKGQKEKVMKPNHTGNQSSHVANLHLTNFNVSQLFNVADVLGMNYDRDFGLAEETNRARMERRSMATGNKE